MEIWSGKDANARIEARMTAFRKCLDPAVTPTLAIVRVGDKAADLSYIKSLERVMAKEEIAVVHCALSDLSTEAVVAAVGALSEDTAVHGILLMQPLPEGVDADRVKEAIDPEKDVDGATMEHLGRTLAGRADAHTYGAPAAVMEMLDAHQVELRGKTVVVVGSGLVVGRPLALCLAQRDATVVMTNEYTKDLASWTQKADIVISAAGVAGLIGKECVRAGQILIDVGVSFVDGKMRGDVDLESVRDIVFAATPTPGGIGSMTSLLIAERTLRAALRRTKE